MRTPNSATLRKEQGDKEPDLQQNAERAKTTKHTHTHPRRGELLYGRRIGGRSAGICGGADFVALVGVWLNVCAGCDRFCAILARRPEGVVPVASASE
jgi:hypothetical protein